MPGRYSPAGQAPADRTPAGQPFKGQLPNGQPANGQPASEQKAAEQGAGEQAAGEPEGGERESGPGGAPGGPGVARRRRRRRWVVVGVVVGVVATGGVVVVTRMASETTAPPPAASRPPATAKVVRTDLVDRIRVDGESGHGAASALSGRKSGTITWLPEPGKRIDRGQTLYAVNAIPVPLLLGTTPHYRELKQGVPAGQDVKELQENLAALGHTDFGTPDGKFGPATTRALKKWQKATGLDPGGVLAVGDVVVLPAPVRVDSLTAQPGGPGDGELMKVTGTGRLIQVELAESRRAYAPVGAKVDVVLPDKRAVPGVVKTVEGKPDSDDLRLTIGLDDPEAAPESGRVRVVLHGEQRQQVLAVPVQALVALVEGGYAVEAVEGRRLIPVTLGMFADGKVEVSGPGLTDGLEVVTTS